MKNRMKHLVSLLLVLATLFSLSSLVACTEQPETPVDTTVATTESPIPSDDPSQLAWTKGGYIASFSGFPEEPGAVLEEENCYFTNVVTIPQKGTTITISDVKAIGAHAFVVSSWKEADGKWKFDPAGANIAATESCGIAEVTDAGVVYKYTTGEDNEHLAFSATVDSEITMEVTGETGSVEKVFTAAGKYTVLQNLRTSILGDSYLSRESYPFVWTEKLTKRYNGTSYNYAKGGATLSNVHTTQTSRLLYRFQTMMKAEENPQIVIIEGGRNDYNKLAKIGDMTADNKDPNTFAGALNLILEGAKEKYPNAMIVLITCWNFPGTNDIGLSHINFVQAMKKMATIHDVYIIDASKVATVGVDMTSASFKATYSENGNSVSHLNEKGMEYVLPKFEKILAEYYLDFLSKK